MDTRLRALTKKDHGQAMELWANSVSDSHDFVSEKDFDYYRAVLPKYLLDVNLYGLVDNNNKLKAFIGVSNDKIELLFVHPKQTRKGYGKFLVNYAINELKIKKVDVNEQNINALRFYEKMGFKIANRSELDGEGLPYPILYLELSSPGRP
ncbi:MAG: GNAT family N-acetyltransferase [Deltaproteobacteria bacterium]|jgi:putative acetyltransferase|nr:GNAT family N-acetyltransferase [Deltaproteobacteria bacterium]